MVESVETQKLEMKEVDEPDCLFVDEVHSLIRSFRRINKYNNEKGYQSGMKAGIPHQVIQDESIRWIDKLIFILNKRRS